MFNSLSITKPLLEMEKFNEDLKDMLEIDPKIKKF